MAAAAQRGLFGKLADIASPPTSAPQPPPATTAPAPTRSYADPQQAMAEAAQRGVWGRLAEIVTPQSSAAQVQAAMRVIAQRTLLGNLADTAPLPSAATSIPVLGPYPNDWMVSSGVGYPDDWIPAEKTLAPDGQPYGWIVPPSSAAPTIEPNAYRDWITPPATPFQNGGFAGAGYPSLNSLTSGSPRPASQIEYSHSVQSSLQAPPLSPYLVPVSGTAQTRPWWAPAPPASAWEPWADEFIKGMQGLINYFRSRGGAGTPKRGGEGDCYDRWEREDARCEQFRPWGTRFVAACKERASARRDKCIRNGGRPDPDEPLEYDFRDIP